MFYLEQTKMSKYKFAQKSGTNTSASDLFVNYVNATNPIKLNHTFIGDV